MSEMTPYKMCIVADVSLGLPYGRWAAQCAHAANAFLVDIVCGNKTLSPAEMAWINTGITKVCLQTGSFAHLESIDQKAQDAGLQTYRVYDQINPEDEFETMTCIAIGPDLREKFDSVTGDLPLL